MAHYLAERQHHQKKGNFLQQFRDEQSKELKQLTASQFMEVWSHYDIDGETEHLNLNSTKILFRKRLYRRARIRRFTS